ncbi:MAG TPA: hypothetical protein VML55_02760 [Planctomycetaceae bacterium]|nr:hypothetical protein [Planctomycetaceae bacterium]
MGKRKQRQECLFIGADDLPRSSGHPFYEKLKATSTTRLLTS